MAKFFFLLRLLFYLLSHPNHNNNQTIWFFTVVCASCAVIYTHLMPTPPPPPSLPQPPPLPLLLLLLLLLYYCWLNDFENMRYKSNCKIVWFEGIKDGIKDQAASNRHIVCTECTHQINRVFRFLKTRKNKNAYSDTQKGITKRENFRDRLVIIIASFSLLLANCVRNFWFKTTHVRARTFNAHLIWIEFLFQITFVVTFFFAPFVFLVILYTFPSSFCFVHHLTWLSEFKSSAVYWSFFLFLLF